MLLLLSTDAFSPPVSCRGTITCRQACMQATEHSEGAVRAREDACADETWNDEEERSVMHEALAPLVNVLVSLHHTHLGGGALLHRRLWLSGGLHDR